MCHSSGHLDNSRHAMEQQDCSVKYYSPLKTGFLFSLNARNASSRSLVCNKGSYAALSKSSPTESLSVIGIVLVCETHRVLETAPELVKWPILLNARREVLRK